MEISPVLPYRYTKAIPFLVDFSGIQGESQSIWEVVNGRFVFAYMLIRSTVAADMNVADTHAAIPFAAIELVPWQYTPLDIGGLYQSAVTSHAKLLLVDPVGVVMTVKGFVYGFEVTDAGVWR